MSERPVEVGELFREEMARGISIATLERRFWNTVDLASSEVRAIERIFDYGISHLRKIAPTIAAEIEAQRSLALKFAGIAKASFPIRKNYEFPSTPGSLGAAWLFPQAIKWVATPTASDPAYTSYITNTWDMDLTAGTPAYFFGSATDFYKANRTSGQNTFLFVFQNGIIEFGSTPSIQQFQIVSEGKRDYGIYVVQPLIELAIEPNKVVYQYPTPLGALGIGNDRGIRFSFLPTRTGRATIKLLGMVFYEHDFAPTLKWVV